MLSQQQIDQVFDLYEWAVPLWDSGIFVTVPVRENPFSRAAISAGANFLDPLGLEGMRLRNLSEIDSLCAVPNTKKPPNGNPWAVIK